ncbi:D-alanine--D-alanine ligase [Demequina sp. TTPB684]|uniref:D-alanine--D-alanine ligase family protein n=1 Tax=unclassified Demequina TaxID=2620311 RepID=UPI001CF3F754|nr:MULTISPECIES: D-alanine--D-alanine ligase [unclassified Demequina]MCB2412670.1 D-alanine--D-alanine ligase [Demequina sp. TTPB684]UPU87953.1 D-alanine--D-alanine ligase [Demequina sp. TMPB413]
MQVLILAGGLSHERDVSIRSGRRVWEALEERGIKATVTDVDTSLLPNLRSLDDVVVWPLLHGASGEDGSLQALLELVDAPFVGTGSREARVAWVKPVAKAVFARAGVSTPDYVTLPQSLFREVGADQVLQALLAKFSLPLVVKPARGGSALGVSLVTEADALAQAMVRCFAYGDQAMIERAVSGTEVAVSVVGHGDGATVLPAVEIACDGPYDYDARYNPGRVEYFAPARLDPAGAAAVEKAALAVHRTMGLRDLSRIDMIVDDAGVAQVIDINIAPGMTETSLFPQAVEASGQELGALYAQIIEGAARR